jgi:hypothetical protein
MGSTTAVSAGWSNPWSASTGPKVPLRLPRLVWCCTQATSPAFSLGLSHNIKSCSPWTSQTIDSLPASPRCLIVGQTRGEARQGAGFNCPSYLASKLPGCQHGVWSTSKKMPRKAGTAAAAAITPTKRQPQCPCAVARCPALLRWGGSCVHVAKQRLGCCCASWFP